MSAGGTRRGRSVGPPRAQTLFSLLDEAARRSGAEEAVVAVDARDTYEGWRAAAAKVAGALAREGVGRGDVVVLICDNRAVWTQILMGTMALGARLAPINTWSKPRELAYMLEHARPAIVISASQVGRQDFAAQLSKVFPGLADGTVEADPRFPVLKKVLLVDAGPGEAPSFVDWVGGAAPFKGDDARPEDVALTLYTSGSTARPKAVALRHRELIENGFQIGARQGIVPGDRIFLSSPLFWAFGSANALMVSLTHQATLVLQEQFRADQAIDLIEAEKCTAIYLMPAMTRALLAEPGFKRERVATLEKGLTIGSAADLGVAAGELGVRHISNIYGSTETYGNCAVTPFDADLSRRSGAQGPALPGMEIRIVDGADRRPVEAGVLGEIEVRGRISPGYVDPEGRPVPIVDEEGWFRTGDIGSIDADGWLSFANRADDLIKSAGINVSPAEVEEVLVGLPGVAEAVVVGGRHPEKGPQVVAFLRASPGAELDPDRLRADCRERLSSYKAPVKFITVAAMPLTDTGKLARRLLMQRADEALLETVDAEVRR